MTYRNVSDEMIVASGQYTKEETYWLNQLAGEPEKSNFPYDYQLMEPGKLEPRMETMAFTLTGEIFEKLIWLSNNSDPRLHMILAAALLALLKKYTYDSAKDTLVGVPVYKQDIDGEFINTILILRNLLDDTMTFKELLLQVKQTVVAATENQNYPIRLLMERMNISLLDIFILLENIHDKTYIQNKDVIPRLIFSFNRAGESIDCRWEYDASFYNRDSVERLGDHFRELLKTALFKPGIRLQDIDILSHQEKKRLLEDFNETEVNYPGDKTIHGLFEEQVERTPDRAAVVGNLTYRELNEKSNQLAHLLRKKGIAPGAVVGLVMEPSPDMITGILGVLKAGGTYLPIDPGHPRSRVSAVLDDCRAPLILTRSSSLRNHSFTTLQGLGSDRAEQGEVKITASCPQIVHMDDLPFPDRSLVSYEKYNRYIGQAMVKHCLALQATRGCPYNCTYCHKIWPKKQVVRSAENIFQEVDFYYQMGVRRFAFIDDIFNLDIKNSSEFFRMIIRSKLDVQFFFPNGLRGDILTKDYIDLMVEAGTIDVALALETASPRLQKLIRKNLNLDKFHENLAYFQEKYPRVILELFTMHGFPTETEEEAMMTLEFIKRQRWLHFPYVHVLKIYPNTDMARLAVENGISGEAVIASANLAYHELPDTLPFDKSFTLNYQANFLNDYFLSKERLLHVLPYQIEALTRDDLVEKYDSYLPVDITGFNELLKFLGIDKGQLETCRFLDESAVSVPDLDQEINKHIPTRHAGPAACRILLLDLSQFFSNEAHMLYDVVEPPLGLMYLLTYLNRQFGGKIKGKIAKSRIDFDNYDELKTLLAEFKPDIIGIRTLTFYKDFFHQTAAVIRQWGIEVPILVGGPYATSDYHTLLQDRNIDLAVLGEGEIITAALVEEILENGNRLPPQDILKDIPGIAFIADKSEHLPELAAEVIPVDQLAGDLSCRRADNLAPAAQPADPAYIIFTSGSTGKPKGVIIEHRNVVRLLFNDRFQFDFSHRDVWTMFHSYCFDFSVWEMYGALLYGGKLVLVPRMIARDTEKFLELLREEQVTVLNQTPSAFYNLIEIQAGNNEKRLALRYVIFGGEALSPAKLREWQRKYPGTRLINMFGITETTVHVTYKEITEQEIEVGLSNIGRPIPTLSTYIMDSCQRLLPPGVPGELYVGSAGVGRGYLNRPELTYEKFCRGPGTPAVRRKKMPMETVHQAKHRTPSLPCKCPPTQWGFSKEPTGRRRQKIYKTGDLVRLLENNDMDYLGRIDRQVQVRGFRVEPGEICGRLEAHPRVKEAVVIPKDINKDLHLCAYIVPGNTGAFDSTPPIGETLKEYLSRTLPDYMIPAFFVLLKKIPLTSNGKVDKKALPEPVALSADKYTAPRDEVEERLAAIWAEVLGRDSLHPPIGIDDNFFELGGHSLKATILIARIHKAFEVKIPLVELFQNPTIRGLGENTRKAAREEYSSISPCEEREYYPLSPAQKRVYLSQQRAPGSTAYNTPLVEILAGNLDRSKVESLFKKLIQRHESFRTSFPVIAGKPVQGIHQNVEFEIEYFLATEDTEAGGTRNPKGHRNLLCDIGIISWNKNKKLKESSTEDTEKKEEIQNSKFIIQNSFIRPFDLSRPPLMRLGIIKTAPQEHILFMDIHHIITDAFSMGIFIKEFLALYSGGELPTLKLQYRDYSHWMNRETQRQSLEKQEAYWLGVFSREIPVLQIPTDFIRPPELSFKGGHVVFGIAEEEAEKIKALVREEGITLFIVLFSLYTILLFKLGGREDIVVGTAAGGRRHAELEQVIGMFVNTLALRFYPCPTKTFREFLNEVGKQTVNAFDNQDYPFENLVEKLNLKRDRSRNPLFDVMFELQNVDMPEVKIPGLTLKPYPLDNDVSKFDLHLTGIEAGERPYFTLTYNKALFKQETVEKFTEYFKKIVTQVLENPDRKLSQIELISSTKQQQVRFRFNENLEDE